VNVGVDVGGSGVNVEVNAGGGNVKVAVGEIGVDGGRGVPHKAGWQAGNKNTNIRRRTKFFLIFFANDKFFILSFFHMLWHKCEAYENASL
jgi:hypothetical protein